MASIVYSNETPTYAEAPAMAVMRVLIVDDEPLARERIRSLLNKEEAMEVIGECGDGEEAVAAIQDLHPDLVFLDVQMPKLDGFDVLEALEPERLPTVIFVTAYDRYAL
jgi:two-component system LytT family response regulator